MDFFNLFKQPGNTTYDNFEADTAAKQKYQKRKKLIKNIIIFFSTIVFFLLISKGNMSNLEKFFLIKPTSFIDLFKGKSTYEVFGFNIYIYFAIMTYLLLSWYLLIKYKKRETRETALSLKLTKISEYFFYPINMFLFTKKTKNYKFKVSWINEIEYNFFKQHVIKVDGYKRVKKLDILKRIFEIYSKGEYRHLCVLFDSEESLHDLYKITEGYIKDVSFDKEGNEKIGTEKKYDVILDDFDKNSLKDFRAFNGRDKVYFSIDYIIYKTQEVSNEFRDFAKKRMFGKRLNISRTITQFYDMFKEDSRAIDMLFGLNDLHHKNMNDKAVKKLIDEEINRCNKFKSDYYNLKRMVIDFEKRGDNLEEEQKQNLIKYKKNLEEHEEIFKELILNKMVIFFKFIYSRMILQYYTNIPAGSVVVKITDYTLRLIVDHYTSRSFISIDKNRNDGKSLEFQNETLANIFFILFEYFMYKRKEPAIKDLEKEINLNLLTAELQDEEFDNLEAALKKSLTKTTN